MKITARSSRNPIDTSLSLNALRSNARDGGKRAHVVAILGHAEQQRDVLGGRNANLPLVERDRARVREHPRVQRVAGDENVDAHVAILVDPVQRNQIELLGLLDLVAIDAEAAIVGHHRDLILLLRLHQAEDVDRAAVDQAAEPRRARHAADEHRLDPELR